MIIADIANKQDRNHKPPYFYWDIFYLNIWYSITCLDKHNFERKIVNIFLPIPFHICFGRSKELSHWEATTYVLVEK